MNFKKYKHSDIITYEPEDPNLDKHEITLDSNVYKVRDLGGMMKSIPGFIPIKSSDDLIKFKTGDIAHVMKTANRFFTQRTRDTYKELKIAHKIGMIFYGTHGTGKTSTCMLIMKELVDQYNSICIDGTSVSLNFIKNIIARIRELQDNPIVLFVDEFDSSIAREEDNWLTFLDGTDAINNLIFIGCTNYIDNIPDRIKNRKSRIKYTFEIKSLPLEVYREYVQDRLPKETPEIIQKFSFLAEQEGLTLDQLKHAIIDYRLDCVSIEEAITDVKKTVGKKEERKGTSWNEE